MSDRHTEALIVNALKFNQGPLTFEDIITRIPELTWNQVFSAVDDLNRTGKVVLTRRGFEYEIRLARKTDRSKASPAD
jgi:hypothetical protein